MAVDRSPAPASTDGDPRAMTFDEAIAMYYKEWILFKILEFNEYHEPVRGLVLAHSPSREAISDALAREPPRSALPPDAPYQPYYTFNAFPRAHVGESLEEARVRFAAQRAAAEERRRAERRD